MAPPLSNKRALREWRLYLFVLPPLALILTFSYFPVASAIYHSFFRWSGGDIKTFVGLENFVRLLSDDVLWRSFGTVFILVVANLLKLAPSMLVAVLIHRLVSDRSQYWYRVLLVLPMIVPGLVTLFIWKSFFDPNSGALNAVLDATGGKGLLVWLDGLFNWGIFVADRPIGWLSQPDLIVPAMIIWGFPWIGTVGVLLYLAGLQGIGTEVYEAADIDGIGPFQKFLYIELPLLLSQVRLTLILLIIGTLQGFGLQLLLLGDGGGPGGRGMVPGLWMYNRAFVVGEFGYACAVGLVIFVFILALTWVNNRYVRVEK